MEKHKIIIIGAGPAGLATALTLNKEGINDILVIEKSKFPRYKCCAGYVTTKTKKKYEEFGLDFNKCNYSLIDDFNVFYKYKSKIVIKNKFMYTNDKIDRVELDNNFYLLAKSKNIQINENETIKNLDMDKNIIETNKETYEYEYLVFADGTTGFGSKFQNPKKRNIAIQYIFNTDKKEEIQIHFGVTKHGYGWISSYSNITNIGITDVYNKDVNYNDILNEFALKMGYNSVDKEKITGAFTPIGILKPIINNNIYYVGDAVGACDPFTLSGLRYCLSTGIYCAKSISQNNSKIYLKYLKKLKFKFLISKIAMKMFYLKGILNLVFNVGCRFFKGLISFVFNNVFVNKK